jgi:exportin-2 (importin alpha re-exporter)
LVQSLSETDYNINTGVLHTAHSIFRQWRAHVRSDELFTEINLVFSKFMTPFLQLFRQTAQACLTKTNINSVSDYNLTAQSMALLVEIYHDFTCQDIPPAIEDSHTEFFGTNGGWFPALMSWDPPELKTDVRFFV